MTDKNRNLIIRIVTALAVLPVIIGLLYFAEVAPAYRWTLGLLYSVGAVGCVYEYYTITTGKLTPPGWAGLVSAVALPLFPFVIPEHAGDLAFWFVAVFFVLVFFWHLIKDPSKEAPTRIAHLTTGLVYGSAGMVALAFIGTRPGAGYWTFAAMCITWMNDTSAYFVGRAFGKRKLYPAISPNKSWEGFFGGMAGSIGVLFAIRQWLFPEITVIDCLILGVLGGIFGPVGDLCESMLKRSYGVKDSGKSIPGHGGMLDRLDALQFNAILVFVYLQFARGFV